MHPCWMFLFFSVNVFSYILHFLFQMDVPHVLLQSQARHAILRLHGLISHFKLMPVLPPIQPGIASMGQLVSLSKSQIPSYTIASKSPLLLLYFFLYFSCLESNGRDYRACSESPSQLSQLEKRLRIKLLLIFQMCWWLHGTALRVQRSRWNISS